MIDWIADVMPLAQAAAEDRIAGSLFYKFSLHFELAWELV